MPKRAKSPTFKKFNEKEFDTVQTAHFNGTQASNGLGLGGHSRQESQNYDELKEVIVTDKDNYSSAAGRTELKLDRAEVN